MMRMTKTRTKKTATSTLTTEKHYTLKGEAWTRYLKDTDQEPKPHPGAQRIYQTSVDGLAVMLMFPFWWFLLSDIEEVGMSDIKVDREAAARTLGRKVQDEVASLSAHIHALTPALMTLDYKHVEPDQIYDLEQILPKIQEVEQLALKLRMRLGR